jgi:hypothetical protein
MTTYILSWGLVYLIIGLAFAIFTVWVDEEDQDVLELVPTAIFLWPLVIIFTLYIMWKKRGESNE